MSAALVETSQGKPRPRPLRKDRMPKTPASAAAAPYRDPKTGKFGAGNPGGRLRQLAALARFEAESLLALAPDAVAPWLRPHLGKAQNHVQALVDALPAQTAELVALCALEAKSLLLANAAVTEGARTDTPPAVAKAWREEARAWMRELRQFALTRKAIARDVEPPDPAEQAMAQAKADFQRRLMEGT